jgi:hypothetical protein
MSNEGLRLDVEEELFWRSTRTTAAVEAVGALVRVTIGSR